MDYVTGEKSDNQITFFQEPAINYGDNLSIHQTNFLCPTARIESAIEKYDWNDLSFFEVDSSPHFHGLAQQKIMSSLDSYERINFSNHRLLPLFCGNNNDGYVHGRCDACWSSGDFDKDDYICRKCDKKYHKECVESPFEIKHPYHPKHFLKLVISKRDIVDCVHCREKARKMLYHCALCNFNMHPVCTMEPVSFVLDQPKRHDHPLTFFTRRASLLDCNLCGLASEFSPTYVCLKCNFVAHKDCAYSPSVIRISRHNHRVSFVLSFPSTKCSCGVCGKNIDSEYGGYTCNKCDNYGVHSRCALRKGDIWDGKELEGVPEEENADLELPSFKIISEGIILHFSHVHPLRVETSKVYDETKICQACIVPIYEGDFYSCMECDFILHDTCTNAPRRKQHALHSHPLTLKVISLDNSTGYFICDVCFSDCCGFIYECDNSSCIFKLDVRCASISVPFHYQGHEHPLSLTLSPGETRECHTCKMRQTSTEALNCIKCDFIICFRCVTVPYMVRYKHEKHLLTLGFGDDETSKPYWCEICEEESPSGLEKRLYVCNHCCTTLHVDCLLGNSIHRYLKPPLTIDWCDKKVQILPNYNFSRPICDYCHRRCGNKIFFKIHGKIYCSIEGDLDHL